MSLPTLIVHERLGTWARQLRPRMAGGPIRLVETRSADDLRAALESAPSACPLVLIDLGDRPRDGLVALDAALRVGRDPLVLVLDSGRRPGVAGLARELGATHVLEGVATPPAVADLLARWIPLARRRSEADGWVADPEPEPEPWEFALAPTPRRG